MIAKSSLWIVGLVIGVVLASLVFATSVRAPNADELQKWIGGHAVAVRTIDAADEDFRDLDPLIEAIGSARVVQLGEPSHGAGGSFAAKVRLIKFLHKRMGFDVLAWESGLYDVHLTQKAMRVDDDAVAAAQVGILLVWSASEEVRPLFEYIKASQSTDRPLEVAGFDMTMNAVDASDRFAMDLRAFVHALRDQELRKRAEGFVEQAIAAHQHLFARTEVARRIELDSVRAAVSGKTPGQSPSEAMTAWQKSDAAKLSGRREDIDALDQAAAGLLAMIRRQRTAFLQVHSMRHITFMERAIENLRGNGRDVYDRERPDRPTAGATATTLSNEDWNRRDALNARNLRWLVEEGYPGRKIIIWAHNVHLMNAYYGTDVNSIHIEPQAGGLEPSGVATAKWLGKDVYTIVMTSYGGEDGWNSAKPIAPAPEGSLEWRLHQLGKPYVFLDLRALHDSPGHPMRKPQSIRLDKYRDDMLTDVTRAFDAIFYLDRMTPATRVQVQQVGSWPLARSPSRRTIGAGPATSVYVWSFETPFPM
jgi:erythromycin esterase